MNVNITVNLHNKCVYIANLFIMIITHIYVLGLYVYTIHVNILKRLFMQNACDYLLFFTLLFHLLGAVYVLFCSMKRKSLVIFLYFVFFYDGDYKQIMTPKREIIWKLGVVMLCRNGWINPGFVFYKHIHFNSLDSRLTLRHWKF